MEFVSRIAALIIILLILPIMIPVSILSIIFQGHPLIYKHERVGYNFEKFNLYKIRTMKKNNSHRQITMPNDQRITFWGRYLRLFKIDEVPQLVNILFGKMRFVGPRPEVDQYVDYKNFSFLKSVKPGITDLSSIVFRNENKIIEKIGGVDNYYHLLKLKLVLCKIYTNKKSFIFDIKLIVLTLGSIFFPKYSQFKVLKIIEKETTHTFLNKLKKLIV